jgi:alkylhydroperoxidase family enzyme
VSRIGLLPRSEWPEPFATAMGAIMPPGVEPLSLFTAVAQSPRAWEKFSGASMSGKGPLEFRHREIVIDRTSAKTGNEYEWGAHVTLFAGKAGLTEPQIASLFAGDAYDGNWSESETAIIAAVDALLDRKKLSDSEFAALAAHFKAEQILEIVQLVGFYHGVALIVGALDLQPEAGMARFPTVS